MAAGNFGKMKRTGGLPALAAVAPMLIKPAFGGIAGFANWASQKLRGN